MILRKFQYYQRGFIGVINKIVRLDLGNSFKGIIQGFERAIFGSLKITFRTFQGNMKTYLSRMILWNL